MKTCELCGTPVKVVGKTTQHYEPIERPKISEEKIEKILTQMMTDHAIDGNIALINDMWEWKTLGKWYAKAIKKLIGGDNEKT